MRRQNVAQCIRKKIAARICNGISSECSVTTMTTGKKKKFIAIWICIAMEYWPWNVQMKYAIAIAETKWCLPLNYSIFWSFGQKYHHKFASFNEVMTNEVSWKCISFSPSFDHWLHFSLNLFAKISLKQFIFATFLELDQPFWGPK